MHADHVLRPPGRGGDRVDVERRRVGREDGAGLRDAVERREHLLLDLHVLEHRLDDEIGVAQIVVGERRPQQRHVPRDAVVREPASLRRALVVRADRRHALVERAGVHLEQHDRNPADRKFIAMPLPIVPAPMTATRSIVRTGVVSGDAGNARRSALGEERVAQRARLGRLHQLEEQLAARCASPRRTASPRRPPRRRCTCAAQASASTIAATVLRANWKKPSASG